MKVPQLLILSPFLNSKQRLKIHSPGTHMRESLQGRPILLSVGKSLFFLCFDYFLFFFLLFLCFSLLQGFRSKPASFGSDSSFKGIGKVILCLCIDVCQCGSPSGGCFSFLVLSNQPVCVCPFLLSLMTPSVERICLLPMCIESCG